jgi:hypothetical protein
MPRTDVSCESDYRVVQQANGKVDLGQSKFRQQYVALRDPVPM